VSQGTVDRALHNRPGISAETRERILLTARQLGYRPDQLASSLVRGRTMTIGLVLFDLYNRFFAQIASAVEENAKSRGYFVYLTLTRKDLGEEKSCIERLAGRRVDGLILCSVG
jgi:LacI family transcriptional regulator